MQTLSTYAGQENNSSEQEYVSLCNERSACVRKSESNRKNKSCVTSQKDVYGAQLYGYNNFDQESDDSWQLSTLYSDYSKSDMDDSDFMVTDYDCDDEYTEISSKESILSWASSILSLSPTARRLVKEASSDGWSLALETLNGPDFHLDVPEKTIYLDRGELSEFALARSNYFSSVLIIALVRALRDVWQEKRNGAFDEDHTPEAILTLERIRAADLDVIAVLVAWELRCEGYNNLWRHILGSEDSDLAMRFSGYLEREPTSHFTHKALAETFTQWFRSEERVNACDHETLNYMDEVLATSNMKNPFGKKSAQKIDIERLSCLPDKTAYLQHHAESILLDPLYAGMSDDINQSHLMHILYDVNVTIVQNVPFRNFDLAERIFPDGMMTPENEEIIH